MKSGWLRQDIDKASKRASEWRNLSPHAEAKLATILWGDEYGPQRLGCMDWYDSLSDPRKQRCREIVSLIAALPREPIGE